MAKRVFDVASSAILLLLALPLIVVLAVALAISLRAWPFFSQVRVGRGGRPFRFIKLRTLPVGTNPYTDKYHLPWPHVPWVARKARRYHLDELPQLVLVLLGRMSMVGPRPELPNLHDAMPGEFAVERTRVRPGCTGLWQIGAGANRLISESPEYDRFYLRYHSLRLDAWIMLRTVGLMLLGWRAVALRDVPEWTRTARKRTVPARLDVSLEGEG